MFVLFFFFFKQKTAYEMRISDWSSDMCSSDLLLDVETRLLKVGGASLEAEQIVRRDGDTLALIRIRLACIDRHGRPARLPPPKIGRASCRERVCQYV